LSNATAIRPRSTSKTGSSVLLGISLLVGLGFIIGFVFPYFRLTAEALGPYVAKKAWILMHIIGGSVALMLGPFVLGSGLRQRRMQLHRKIGLAYMVSIGFSSVAAFYLAAHTDVSWVFGMGLTGLGIAWVTTTGLAFISIKRRLITQHKEWMIRSYVATFGFVSFRIMVGVLTAANVGSLIDRLAAASWFCWAFPLLVTELILQGKKIFSGRISAV
jgi:hypothetical protein